MNKPTRQPAKAPARTAAEQGERGVRITAKPLDALDLERFVAALIAMAMARLEEKKGQHD